MQFDNHDARIKYYPLRFVRATLDGIVQPPLPDGYSFCFYRDGDRDAWIDIEKSAKEFHTFEDGVSAWNRYYSAHEAELPERMLFVRDESGKKIATATAFCDVFGEDTTGAGWLHWVAVQREIQGRGLSKPLIARTLLRLKELGYTHAIVPSQTTTWLACKIYMDFGFVPTEDSVRENRDGWRILKALTHHPALASFDAADLSEFLIEK
ncbi:MAG: GNAT family N-acetyltransferase [Christensenellales bacterium]|jgi:GNAT superfamily N-acetyltransferase